MKITSFPFLLLILLAANRAHAFDWSKCKSESNTWASNAIKNYNGKDAWFGMVFFSTVEPTMSATVSSSKFTWSSSKSGCGLFGRNEMRKQFIAENLYHIKIDSAKGSGEYLQALAVLSGCEQKPSMERFESLVHQNFRAIYASDDNASDIERVPARIDRMIGDDGALRASCEI